MTSYHAITRHHTPGCILTQAREVPHTRYAHDPIPRMSWTTRNVEGLMNTVHSMPSAGFKPTPPFTTSRDVGDPGSIQYPLDLSDATPSSANPRPITDTTRYTVFK